MGTALAVGLLFFAACSSNGTTPPDGAGTDAAGLEAGPDAMCRAPTPAYGPSTHFEFAQDAPLPPADCPLACGETMWEPSIDYPNVDVALPYGACAATTPACRAGARVPCACANSQGPVHSFVCACETGQWVCRIRTPGAAACAPCDGGTD
jgi:hypothetical protein